MEKIKTLYAIDSHTMGEPTRIVVEGLPEIEGKTMMEKKAFLQNEFDYIRKAIMNEPRGHRNMFGAAILKPTRPDADIGVVFMDNGGYLNMCGHGTIGTATIAVEEKLVAVTEPYTYVTLEAPAGLVHTKILVENGKAKEVSFVNVPSFLYQADAVIEVPSVGTVKLDIAFGGNFFAIVEAEPLGLRLVPENVDQVIDIGDAIRKAVNSQIKVEHPLIPDIRSVDLVEFYGPSPLQGEASLRNSVFFGSRQIDRSPCGTGTSAKLATLFAKKKLQLNEDFYYESILGTRFKGRAIEKTLVGKYEAIIPEITGRAFITGKNRLVFQDEDPFQYGFAI